MSERDDLIKEKLDMMNPERVQREEFLDLISQIESSGGTNTNHPVMEDGIHAGQAAIGRFGLMPNTIKELVKRAELNGVATDPMRQIASQDPQQMKAQVEQNPDLEFQMADQLARRVLNKFGDPEKAAYSWNQGTNLKPEQVEQRKYQDSDYVQRFRKLRKMIGGES